MVEFVDILCSMGACGLIVIAGVLFVMRSWNARNWQALEKTELPDDYVEDPVEEMSQIQRVLFPRGLRAIDFQVMAKRFVADHNLPEDFEYSSYLNGTLVRNACDLMDIEWTSWLVFLVVSLMMLAFRSFSRYQLAKLSYLYLFSICNWACLAGFTSLLCIVNIGQSVLMDHIREEEEELQRRSMPKSRRFSKKEIKVHPMANLKETWVPRAKWTMQLLALTCSFMGSFYIMHLHFNIKAGQFHWLWVPFLTGPLMVSLFVVLPLVIARFTVVESFFSPDADALEEALIQINQLEDDFDHVRRMWQKHGRPALPNMGEGVDEDGLREVFKELGIHVHSRRLHRIFIAMDTDDSGNVDAQELLTRLHEKITREHASGSTSSFSLQKLVGGGRSH